MMRTGIILAWEECAKCKIIAKDIPGSRCRSQAEELNQIISPSLKSYYNVIQRTMVLII